MIMLKPVLAIYLSRIMSSRPDQVAKEQAIKDIQLVPLEKRLTIGRCNMRIDQHMKQPKEVTYQVALDSLKTSPCYKAFTVTADVPVVYMHQFWTTIHKKKSMYHFKLNNKKFGLSVEDFRDALNMCPHVAGKEFDNPPLESDALQFIRDLGHKGNI